MIGISDLTLTIIFRSDQLLTHYPGTRFTSFGIAYITVYKHKVINHFIRESGYMPTCHRAHTVPQLCRRALREGKKNKSLSRTEGERVSNLREHKLKKEKKRIEKKRKSTNKSAERNERLTCL